MYIILLQFTREVNVAATCATDLVALHGLPPHDILTACMIPSEQSQPGQTVMFLLQLRQCSVVQAVPLCHPGQ